MSHTASISTSDVKVRDYEELVDTVKALALNAIPKGDRVAVFQPSGAECVMSAVEDRDIFVKTRKLMRSSLGSLYQVFSF